MCGTTCFVTSAVPMMLTLQIDIHSSGVASMPLRMKMAALLTSTVGGPARSATWRTASTTLASSLMSPGT